MRARHFINSSMALQSRELLRDPRLMRIIICQIGISNAGVLLLAFLFVISCGSCSRVIKGDAFKDDVINLRRGPIQQYAQEAFCCRNEDLKNCIDFAVRNKALNLGQLLLADRRGHYQLLNIQSGTKLFCCPAILSSSFGQAKLVCVGSRALLLQSSSLSSSRNPIFTSTSAAVRPPAHQASVHPPGTVFPKTQLSHSVPIYQQSYDAYDLHEPKASPPLASTSYQGLLFPSTSYLRGVPSMPNTLLSSSLRPLDNSHLPLSVITSLPASQSSSIFSESLPPCVTHLSCFQSPHISSLSPSQSAIQPSQSLVHSAGPDLAYVQPINGRDLAIVFTSLPDESMAVRQMMESPPSLLHPVMRNKRSLISELDPVPPVSQLPKQGSEHLGFLQTYSSLVTPSYFLSPDFLPEYLPVSLASLVPEDNVPFNGSALSNPQRTPPHSGSPVSFVLPSSGPVAIERDKHVQTAASPCAAGMLKVLTTRTQNTQEPCRPPTGTAGALDLPPTAPLLVDAAPPIPSYDMQSPEPSSQAFQSSERLHSERTTSTLAPRHPLSVNIPQSVPSHGRSILEPSFQSVDPPEKTFSARVLPPLNARSLPMHSPAIPYLQGPSGHKLQPPETVSSKMDRPSMSSTQLLPVIIPPSFAPHAQLHHAHHSAPGSVMLDSSNSFPNHPYPRPFNDPSPALPPVLHSRTSVSPAGMSRKKKRKPRLVTIPATVPVSSKGNVVSPVSSVPSSAARERSRRHTTVAMPPMNKGKPGLAPSTTFHSHLHHQDVQGPVAASPRIAPHKSLWRKPTKAVAASPMTARSPPPHQDCTTMTCTEPFTSSPLDSPCGCVLPMQVELELEVTPYAFFPLVSELAAEIAAGTYLKQSQVRIMGANADSQDQGKTYVNIDLVPLGEKFDNTTALLTYERFWKKKVIINETLFGDYRVIFVHYSGLPPSPPYPFSDGTRNGGPNRNIGGPGSEQPLGVDIRKRSEKLGGGTISAVALSSAITVIIFLGAVWFILLKYSNQNKPPPAVAPVFSSSVTKRSGAGFILSSSMASSASLSFASSMATYTGSAKTFTLAELEKATDRFNPRNIVGEGGFGRVYRGVLEDGTQLAVKVLTRDDQQGGREFIAEVEMLSRLHHRNLVKLLGICTEGHNRCLVYELIPNGSVESHLHGQDKENAPLDWDARMKIALGAARGLAYLHEDSNPRVIHRDFKASNILLEDDFTPKVSDFGLAKAASDEGSEHISTRVMGTFGYVAPEYAMTGHLLVKSDVYSYGVVLLELLSGRKPVDMSQPPGQENLVTWARPLLTNKEGLEILVDPALGGRFSFDNMARVAAIASMCVQPEVSHRPFMGEVVQALKLVYNDSDASNGGGSGNYSQVGDSLRLDNDLKDDSDQTWWPSTKYVPDSTSFVTIDYDSGPLQAQELGTGKPLSASALLSSSGRFVRQPSGSFRRHSSPGPLRTNRSKISRYRGGGLTGGSKSEHSFMWHFDMGIDKDVHELWP